MIPYIDIPDLVLWGGIKLRVFGLLVYVAMVTAYFTARWRAGRVGQEKGVAGQLVIACLVGGLLMSHGFAIAFYHPEELAEHGWLHLFRFWTSMSSYGGFVGGTLAAWVYLRVKKLPLWEHLDTIVVALVAGWFFGRLGCATVHDHPGLPSQFFLAVKFPDGPRHDLGLYECIFTLFLNGIVLWRAPRKHPPGLIVAIVALSYAPVRFGMDFLRVSDRHILGLTPGQYASIVLLALGLWIARDVTRRHRASLHAPGGPAARTPPNGPG